MNEKKEWFAEWFDSKYYHILYQNRDEKEADSFIKLLCKHLSLPKDSAILDLACGKGRHALIFNSLGYNTYASDLSKNSIKEAKKLENDKLHFLVQDMRNPFPIKNLDLVCNLFTSFGYFESTDDNKKVLLNIYSALKQDALLVLDFMNVVKVCSSLPISEEKYLSDIKFNIKKYFDSTHIYKEINFTDKGINYNFIEKVQNLSLSSFENLLFLSKFKILQIFGSYQLTPFDENKSDRLIIIAQK